MKLVILVGLGLDLVLSIAWSLWVQLMVFIRCGISVVLFDTERISQVSQYIISVAVLIVDSS